MSFRIHYSHDFLPSLLNNQPFPDILLTRQFDTVFPKKEPISHPADLFWLQYNNFQYNSAHTYFHLDLSMILLYLFCSVLPQTFHSTQPHTQYHHSSRSIPLMPEKHHRKNLTHVLFHFCSKLHTLQVHLQKQIFHSPSDILSCMLHNLHIFPH